MSAQFHVQRKNSLQTLVRYLIGLFGLFLALGWFFGRLRRTAVYQALLGSALLLFLCWGLR